jgi:YHS domain-containing protein
MTESRAFLNNNNIGSTGVALEGYCPVAYFAVNKPLKGDPQFASDYKDVTYWFVSADAKKAFDEAPEKYIPAFGGWCAYGAFAKDRFPIDPTNFKIVDGRLLVFLKNKNVDALQLWNKEKESTALAAADQFWAKINA